ncbi:hypothetical protein ABEB36_001505 [Hypothenemus hampei]|uniref:C2H2-type domain-containing protein n=1 Tax=Hypothenemus hampei TaxID=57062 RepID=A0ABD1FEU5_HYPHA
MNIEDGPNSYLSYLNDSEAPNAYLLENNEVGMCSVEPIFMEDWPQEGLPLLGFPLVLTNNLITEDDNQALTEQMNVTCSNKNQAPIHSIELVDDDIVIAKEAIKVESKNISEEDSSLVKFNTQNLELDEHLLQLTEKQEIATEIAPILIDNSVISSTKKEIVGEVDKLSLNNLFSSVIANKCKHCSFLCEEIEQIKSHIALKHPELYFQLRPNGVSLLNTSAKEKNNESKELTVYVCSECRGICTNKSDLKKHMVQAHGLENEHDNMTETAVVKETDNESAKKTYSTYLDDVHVSLVKKQEKIQQQVKCTIKGCSAGFPNETLKRKHEKLHINDNKSMFKCSECDKNFMLWDITRNHMKTEHGIDFGLIVCPMCNIFKSYRAVLVLKHMTIHGDSKPFLCVYCGKGFRQLAQLKNHEVTHKLPEDMPSWSKVKKCDKCQRFFSNSKSLKIHIKTVHEHFKPFICNICGHKSSRKAMLELHIRQHTASKPHKCNYCQFKTGDPNSLRKHTMKHLGAASYQCPHCPYSCIQASSIKRHLLNKHKEKAGVYSCKYCRFTTINEANWTSHEKNHEASYNDVNNEIRPNEKSTNDNNLQTDEETQSYFLNTESQMEETVDNGGITIPAGLEMPLVS